MPRRPTPIALRLLKGNPQRRPIPSVPRIEPLTELPPPPPHLDSAACGVWRDTGQVLVARGVLCELDLTLLEVYAGTVATWRQAIEELQKTGLTISAATGARRNPLTSIAGEFAALAIRLASELGCSAPSRVRAWAGAGHRETDKLDDLLA